MLNNAVTSVLAAAGAAWTADVILYRGTAFLLRSGVERWAENGGKFVDLRTAEEAADFIEYVDYMLHREEK